MPRPLTYKTLQTHTQCSNCGFGEVDHEEILISHRELIKLAKFKKRKKGNFYSWVQQIDCEGKGHESID